MVIAIDGPAGTGTSTVASLIANELNVTFLDSRSVYRGLTLAFFESGVDL